MDAGPTVAVVVADDQLSFFKGIHEQDQHAPVPEQYDGVAQGVLDAVKAGWPSAKLLPMNESAGADLIYKITFRGGYTTNFNPADESVICNPIFRVEPTMNIIDGKTNEKVAGPWSLGVVTDSASGCDVPAGATIDDMMGRFPPESYGDKLSAKVSEKAKEIVADIKAADAK